MKLNMTTMVTVTFLSRIVALQRPLFARKGGISRSGGAAFANGIRRSWKNRRLYSTKAHAGEAASSKPPEIQQQRSTKELPVGPGLPSSKLRWRCDPDQFDFKRTDELNELNGTLLGQERAESAIQFGCGMKHKGYNLFVLGPSGSGKRSVIRNYLENRSLDEPPASDWAYVHNFDHPDNPKALKLPPGLGQHLKEDIVQLTEDMQVAIPAALESSEHRQKLQQAEQQVFEEHQQAIEEISEEAASRDLLLIKTSTGVALGGPASNRSRNPEEEPKPVSPEKEKEVENAIEELTPKLDALLHRIPELKKKAAEKKKELNQQEAKRAIEFLFSPLKKTYEDLPEVITHLEAVEADVIENADSISSEDEEEQNIVSLLQRKKSVSFDLYKINLLVDNSETMETGAPVIYEDHPLYQNLIGRVEYQGSFGAFTNGAFTTNFSLIKAGSLHRANGGYLVVHARDVLMEPFSWEALKRSLRLGQIKVETLGEQYSLISTASLRPESIDLDVKVVLLGDRLLYYLLEMYDPDFDNLFKVAADFNDQMDNDHETCQLYAEMLGTIAKREDLKPLDRKAVAAMIEQAAKQVGDQHKLSTHVRSCADLLLESNYWAGNDGANVIEASHVQKAIDQQIYRSDRVRELIYEAIHRRTILVDINGSRVGQVNGLSVMSIGSLSFGRPSRITATARLGKGKVVDIEREVELGGATHSKGVMILSSLLSSRYVLDRPLCLSASLVFEQSYGMIDGDSASMAELCAILSALADIPIRQGLAITGSVNQLGQAQAIGGATEKIEGFYDVCKAVGLTGEQGVLIPEANVEHLMLRPDILEAVDNGQFSVHSYNSVDEAVTLLTGVEAGDRSADGTYPPHTLNYLVDNRLEELAELVKKFSSEDSSDSDNK